jgi:hypothetical protein
VEEQPPYEAYAAIAAAFLGALTGASLLARSLGRDPRGLTALDLIALAGATFKASRTISRDPVASFVREPFVEGEADSSDEQPAGEGMQRAIGELVTCTRCVGTWVGAGLATTQILAPRFGRALTWTLSAAAANDFLQAGFAALTARANRAPEPE